MKKVTKYSYSRKEAKDALESLLKSGAGFQLPIQKNIRQFWGYTDKEVRDGDIPLLCEYSLYPLLGKDEARNILADLRLLKDYFDINATQI